MTLDFLKPKDIESKEEFWNFVGQLEIAHSEGLVDIVHPSGPADFFSDDPNMRLSDLRESKEWPDIAILQFRHKASRSIYELTIYTYHNAPSTWRKIS